MHKAYSKYFWHNYFSEPIFKILATLFTTFGLQKDDMDIFALWCFKSEISKNVVSERWCTDSNFFYFQIMT